MSRRSDVQHLTTLLRSPALVITDPASGWPALGTIALAGRPVPIAIYTGRLSRSHRGRDHVERRFQNPGKRKPIAAPDGALPLLVGLWSEEGGPEVLVGMDALPRIGLETRYSLFVPLAAYREALWAGWVEHVNASGERIFVFSPEGLPAFAAIRHLEMVNGSGR